MPSDEIVISARNLSKSYRLFGHPGDRVKQFLSFGLKQYHREFTALKDVSFDIRRGETIGIIGRNGSGKSTLLHLICGILKPTSGTVQVNGRISALLELGAGFNPEFTGRENIYFQGALMGLTATQMDGRFDDIAGFADIGEFIDQPVRTYSSGMFVRLAFSVAIHVNPEILVVDEALAVGDAGFQLKCFERIHAIREAGGCILLVTHSAEQVAHFCDRAILLEAGYLIAEGNSASTLAHYINRTRARTAEDGQALPLQAENPHDAFQENPAYNPDETRWGDRIATIDDFHLFQEGLRDPPSLTPGLAVDLHLRVRYRAAVERPIYGLAVKSREGALLFGTNSRDLCSNAGAPGQQAGDTVDINFRFHPFLNSGEYFVSVGIVGESTSGIVVHDRRYDAIRLRIEHPLSTSEGIAMNPSFNILGPT
ncbi:MAG TPA: ABC transporter ATP-binding protein [Thauera sp.]|nr:ABC transporter ATP-binding protein [Thauera sp.]